MISVLQLQNKHDDKVRVPMTQNKGSGHNICMKLFVPNLFDMANELVWKVEKLR